MLFYTVVHLIFRKIFFPFFCQFVLCGGPSPALRAPLSVRRAAPSAAAARFSLPSRWFSRGVRRGSSGAARAGSRPSYPYSCLRWSLCVCSATVRTRAAHLRTVGSWRAWKPPGRDSSTFRSSSSSSSYGRSGRSPVWSPHVGHGRSIPRRPPAAQLFHKRTNEAEREILW